LDQILNKEKRVLIGADTKLWHAPKRNKRGRIVEELIEKFDLKVHNVHGKLNNYDRERMGSSNIDVTMSTTDIRNLIQSWDVKNVTDSDHRILCFELATVSPHPEKTSTSWFNVRTADWDLFRRTLTAEVGGISETNINCMAEGIDRVLALTANRSMEKCRARNPVGKNIWWSLKLSTLRRDLIRARRQGLRTHNRPAYNVRRNIFLTEIRKQKMAAWKVFANDTNEKVWGKAFKFAKNGSKRDNSVPSTLIYPDGNSTTDCHETAELILNTFVPSDHNQGDWQYMGTLEEQKRLDPTAIKAAIWRIKPSSAPGIDGITAGMIRKTWLVLCGPITDLFGRCITEGRFPESWKKAKLVIIPKPGGGEKDRPKSYRPISLLSVLGKALETIIIKAIDRETNLDLFTEQHGFTIGKSTSNAIDDLYTWVDGSKARHIFGTFLDITGAFDNMKWAPLLEQLRSLGVSLKTLRIINSYLTNRWADFESENVHYITMLERGCPQGSQLGPTL